MVLRQSFGRACAMSAGSMSARQLKAGTFVLEGLNAFATSFYFYYLFFFMQRQFGFGNRGNLALAALNGLIYTFMAWSAGRFGQRVGYFKALRLGFVLLSVSLGAGAFLNGLYAQIGVMMV